MSERDEYPPGYEVTKLKYEMVSILSRAQEEIQTLRRRLEVVEPKAAAYDNLAIVLSLLPKQSMGMAEDIVWRFKRRAEELEAEMAKAKGQFQSPKAD